jgi:small subunit ribosomal protein S9
MTEEPQKPEGEQPEEDQTQGEAPGPEIEGAEELAQAAAQEEAPAEEEEAAPAEEEEAAPAEEEAEAPAAEEEAPAAEEPAAEGEPADVAAGDRPRPGARRKQDASEGGDEVIPGAHLEPDLVLEEKAAAEQAGEYGEFDQYVEADTGEETAGEEAPSEAEPVAHTPLDLAADARYAATGKRKSAVARVILKPGEGTYNVNGRHLDEFFPRVRLQRMARQPLEAAGYQARMDVVARIHGGGVSAQATALRHGIARALVEADPALRGELKRRGYLTRDPRVKERKKAGLKKARKRPQFSKR